MMIATWCSPQWQFEINKDHVLCPGVCVMVIKSIHLGELELILDPLCYVTSLSHIGIAV